MAKRVQFVRHATAAANAFTGKDGEITVDTTKKAIRVHDGATAGGFEMAKDDLSNVQVATASNAGKMSAAQAALLDLTAGVAQANKAVVLGATKNIDVINIALGGLQINGVAVGSSAAEIDVLDGVTPGTALANKALVLDGSKNITGVTGITTTNLITTNLTLGGVAVTLTSVDDKIDNFPSGTAMLFYQASAPTGWTEAGGLSDHALRVVTVASANGGSSGGVDGFSTRFNGTSGEGSGVVGAHQLIVSEIPAHTHTYDVNNNDGAGYATLGTNLTDTGTIIGTPSTNAAGGDGTHDHSLVLNIKYANVIVAAKD